jgi:hypothetical protein
MSATADRFNLHVHDHRTPALNGSPSGSLHLTNLTAEEASLVASFVIDRAVDVPGSWRLAIAGGIRHLQIEPTENPAETDEPSA